MRIVDGCGPDGQRAGRGLYGGIRTNLADIESGRNREWLERGPGLEHVGERTVAHPIARSAQPVVRVVRGPVRDREEFAALRVHDHQAARLRLVRFHRCLELAEGEVLQAGVDREREIAPFLRWTDAGHVLDGFATTIDDDAPAARFPAEPFLLTQLHAFLSDVVIAGEAQDVAHAFAARIVAAVPAFSLFSPS